MARCTGLSKRHKTNLILFSLTSIRGRAGLYAPAWLEAASWRPYINGDYIRLDDLPYLEALGLGVNFMNPLTSRILLDANIEHKAREFHDGGGGSQTITELDGNTTDVRLAFRVAAADDVMLTFAIEHSDQTVDGKINSFRESREWTGSVGATKVYQAPGMLREWGVGAGNDPWTTSLTLSRGRTKYNAPDPSVDPATKRQEEEFRATFVHSVPISADFTLLAIILRESVSSNLPNFERSNT